MFSHSFQSFGNQNSNDLLKSMMGSSSPQFSESKIKIIKKCDICNSEKNLKLCSRCKTIYYCSQECQKKGWEKHKLQCKKIMNSSE